MLTRAAVRYLLCWAFSILFCLLALLCHGSSLPHLLIAVVVFLRIVTPHAHVRLVGNRSHSTSHLYAAQTNSWSGSVHSLDSKLYFPPNYRSVATSPLAPTDSVSSHNIWTRDRTQPRTSATRQISSKALCKTGRLNTETSSRGTVYCGQRGPHWRAQLSGGSNWDSGRPGGARGDHAATRLGPRARCRGAHKTASPEL